MADSNYTNLCALPTDAPSSKKDWDNLLNALHDNDGQVESSVRNKFYDRDLQKYNKILGIDRKNDTAFAKKDITNNPNISGEEADTLYALCKQYARAIVASTPSRRKVLYDKSINDSKESNHNWIYPSEDLSAKRLKVPLALQLAGFTIYTNNVYPETHRICSNLYLGKDRNSVNKAAYISKFNAIRMYLDMLARAHLKNDYKDDEEKKNHIMNLEWWIVLIVNICIFNKEERELMHLWMNNTDRYEYTGHQDGYRGNISMEDRINLLGTDIRYLSEETDPSAYDGTLYLPSVNTTGYSHSNKIYYYNNHFLFNYSI